MSLRDWSKGDGLGLFWRLFYLRERVGNGFRRKALTLALNRMAHRHGGCVGNGAVIEGVPVLPHGLHGVYLSRYAHLGAECRIYQNVTIWEVGGKAPPAWGKTASSGRGPSWWGASRWGTGRRSAPGRW